MYMNHRKAKHSEIVPSCKNEITGGCQYGSQNCWFNHNNIQIDEYANMNENTNENMNNMKNNPNNEIMQKLVEMVEKYSQRIIKLENMLVKH